MKNYFELEDGSIIPFENILSIEIKELKGNTNERHLNIFHRKYDNERILEYNVEQQLADYKNWLERQEKPLYVVPTGEQTSSETWKPSIEQVEMILKAFGYACDNCIYNNKLPDEEPCQDCQDKRFKLKSEKYAELISKLEVGNDQRNTI